MVRNWGLILLVFLLAACARAPAAMEEPVSQPEGASAAAEQPASTVSQPTAVTATSQPATQIPYRSSLDDLGAAPELKNEVWLNTEGPLRLADLQGKVVLLDMWTFG